MNKQIEKVEGLNIQLHGIDVAIIAHYAGGNNILTFNPILSICQKKSDRLLH